MGVPHTLSCWNSDSVCISNFDKFVGASCSYSHNRRSSLSCQCHFGIMSAVDISKRAYNNRPYPSVLKVDNLGTLQIYSNPMYLGLFLGFIGVDLLLTFIWSLILILFLVYYVNWIVIPIEEAQLRRTFREAYEQYCKRVRRWV